MVQSNVVFLIDVNGVPRDPKVDSGGGDISAQDDSFEMFPFKEEEDRRFAFEKWTWLKDFVLLTLFKEANKGNDYDLGSVQWSFKFFDSSHLVNYSDGRTFLPFDWESFSNFEKQLGLRMGTVSGEGKSESQFEFSHVKYLSDAIKYITGSLSWSESQSQSLNLSRSFTGEVNPVRNSVFAFIRVPRTEKELLEFTDLQSTSSSRDVMNVLLPSAFSHKFHHQLKIQLNFIDMWTAPENSMIPSDASWNGDYPRQIVKCLQYLGNGKVSPISDFSILSTGPLSFGLLPYPKFLKLRLQQLSEPNENIPSHIKRLAPATAKNSQKTSPDFDTASVSRSMKSGPSVLDATINSQNKVLRPFRMSGGYENDDEVEYRRHRLSDIKAHDRLRDGERKRKRHEYDHDDYYAAHDRRRIGLFDDTDHDSVEVDSQCEREQRLESWVNDGVFSAKRKKHVDSSTVVPMSRPLNKSTVVFHEPAPKLPASRSKKMLANVERQKLKVHAVETKRRSSEGLDLKRITQHQEKELSAIKRRLKIHLEGELEIYEDDPIAWLKSLSREMRRFADQILEEDNPCLVALAQALVNSASTKFTQQRLKTIRDMSSKSVTAKDLLEEILLVKFTNLNKKIISAHEINRDKMTSNGNGLQKILAFRETELQIILRLEIAWCFVEPDEDATEDLLMEIVRLLQIIAAYRTKAPIDHFINNVLLPTYSQCNKFMRALYKKMNIPLPVQLAMDGSPVPSSSRRDDDSSMISSTSSANLCPEDSASQLNLCNRRMPSHAVKRYSAPHHSGKKTGSGPKKLKRQIMVSNPKLSTSQFISERTDSQRKFTMGGGVKSSPKRVRRNLFDVQKIDPKDSKTLIKLASSSRVAKSPAFKSPKGKSPLSPSGFFRVARSRRQVLMSNQPTDTHLSPTMNSDVLCPESPATPNFDRRSISSKYAATITSSCERPRVIQESPEVIKNDFERPMARVASLSFYSTGSGAPKSRAWEKSEAKLMAAKLKDSVDLRSKNLTLDDFEDLPCSPDRQNSSHVTESPSTPGTALSICPDSYSDNDKQTSPIPSTSNAHSLQELTGPAPDLNNPNIAALITSQTFPLSASGNEISVITTQYDPGASPSADTAGIPNNMVTPSKRVQFNLHENLVNTPASVRRISNGTPKSILKETHEERL